MRTTLELDDDLVQTAKDLAREQGVTIGQVVSKLARQSLASVASQKLRNGVPVFQSKGTLRSSIQTVNDLRDDV